MNVLTQLESCLEQKRKEAYIGGGEEKIHNQHVKGKLTARERIEVLLDENSFEEYGVFVEHRSTNFNLSDFRVAGDGMVVGRGTINGRTVFLYSQDFTVMGGSLSETNAKKICQIMDIAGKVGAPIIGLNDSGGARIQEGVDALSGYGEIFQRNVDLSGVVPQISLIMGPCAGGAVYSPALTDFTFMVRGSSYMFVTGPDVVRKVTYEDISHSKLGGAQIHSEKTGVADLAFANDVDALLYVRQFLGYLPDNNLNSPAINLTDDAIERVEKSLDRLVPPNSSMPYDMRELIYKVADNYEFNELQSDFARNILIGFIRIGGITSGIVANQPLHLAGCLDIDSSRKAARFVRFCDAFNIPIISFVDVPGFMPGVNQEYNGIIKHGAKLLYAYAEATVPKITLITRKAYGGAYIVMGSKHLKADINYCWSTAEIAVMGPEAAVEIIFKKYAQDPAKLKLLASEYRDKFTTPAVAASRGYIDNIISPSCTRKYLYDSLKMLQNKKQPRAWRKHDNLPL